MDTSRRMSMAIPPVEHTNIAIAGEAMHGSLGSAKYMRHQKERATKL